MNKASSSFLLVAVSALFITLQAYAQPIPHPSAPVGGRGPGYNPPVPGQGRGPSVPPPAQGGYTQPGSGHGQPGPGYGRPGGQRPIPQSMLTLQLNQRILGHQEIDLTRLARQQLGVDLRFAQIQRVAIVGSAGGYGRSASVRLEVNNRPASQTTYLGDMGRATPLRVSSYEQIQRLELIVDGDAMIQSILIRIGDGIGQQHPGSQSLRLPVGQQLMANSQLLLANLAVAGNVWVQGLSIQGSSLTGYQTNVLVMTLSGEVLGQIIVSSGGFAGMVRLPYSVSLRDLKLVALGPVHIQSIDLDL